MKNRTATLTGLLATTLAISCARFTGVEELEHLNGATRESTATRALNWLQAQQNEDGSWGEHPHREILTSAATLAFLAEGQTPVSATYGACSEEAMKWIHQASNTGDFSTLDSQSQHWLFWATGECYSFTRVPLFKQNMTDMKPQLSPNTSSPLKMIAVHVPPTRYRDSKQILMFQREEFDVIKHHVFTPTELLQKEHPYLTLLLAGRYYLTATNPDNITPMDWFESHRNWFEFTALHDQKLASWTRDSTGGSADKGLASLSPVEDRIYVTAMMIICTPPSRYFPTFHSDLLKSPDMAPEEGNILLGFE